jgi:hypothetical protein
MRTVWSPDDPGAPIQNELAGGSQGAERAAAVGPIALFGLFV